MESSRNSRASNARGRAVAVVLLLLGVLNLAYALAAGPDRPADALQGVGLLLLGFVAAVDGSATLAAALEQAGRRVLVKAVLALSILAGLASVALRVV